jgi:SET domain-containing protein
MLITSITNDDIDFTSASPIHGIGVFARRTLKAGERFIIYHDDFNGFNHSCDANIKIIPNEGFEVLRDIEVGEELAVDYGSEYWWQGYDECNCQICRSDRCDNTGW